ncbi:MAG: 50S ribosomal protein L29 [Legionellales bacterium]|nr:50S ribosomal protein L29 [Legionellales bacterium]|tara:strand:+ start:340 stop:534 length:195 start_codon:yes stop_codon:yes gene_type:complete
MKMSEIRAMSSKDIRSSLSETQKELFQLRVRRASGQAEGMLHKQSQLKKHVARLYTVLKEQEGK